MATALAAQLAQLAAAQSAQERYVRGRPSLLFDYQKAADVSAEQVLSIARAGKCRVIRCLVDFASVFIVWHALLLFGMPYERWLRLRARWQQQICRLLQSFHCASLRTTCATLHVLMMYVCITTRITYHPAA